MKTTSTGQKKIAIFVDVQNIYYTTRDAFGRQFNYQRLWNRVSREGDIVFAIAYAVDRGDSKQLKFQNALRQIGFTVKLKPWIQRADGSAKGDWDVGITIDMMTIAPTVNKVVLLSGDGDFQILLDHLRDDPGIEADVYGVPTLTAEALVKAASRFHSIDEGLLI